MTTITVIRGDGIGPEIMDATLHVLDAMQLGLQYEFADAGLAALEKHGELLPASTLDSIRKNRIALKSPLTTPVGEGFSSINVELRKRFDLYANVRPAKSFPNTKSRFTSGVDLITVRENTEGAYIGEGQSLSEDGETAMLTQKITRRGSERIVRYAFDLARKTGRKKVTVVHKANILKSTSGLFLKTAREVAQQYPDIQCNEMIVDNTCMQLVMKPEQFDIIVTTNLFGDIISDLCAGLVGGLGLAPGANIGTEAAIFEAVHGSAPDIAGKGIANPCALLLGAAQMLDHLALPQQAERLRKAIIATLEAKDALTPDLGGEGNTMGFAQAIATRLSAGVAASMKKPGIRRAFWLRRKRRQSRDCNLLSRRRISRYSHTSVTSRPNAAYHSMYFGAPCSTPFSMKSKSSTRFSAAITTTKPEKAMPIRLLSWMKLMPLRPNRPRPICTRYSRAIPPVAATTPSLKFSVALIRPLR